MKRVKQKLNLLQIVKQSFQRLCEPTPQFFAFLRKISATVTLLSGFVLVLDSYIALPEFIKTFFNFYSLNSGIVGTLLTSLASVWRNPDGSLNEKKKAKYIEEKAKNLEIVRNIDVG